jgi:hypothetical protein
MSHRRSYWKTIALALGCATGAAAATALATASGLPTALKLSFSVLLVLAGAAFALVAAGGLVCLWRDRRARDGQSDLLATLAFEQAPRGLVSRLFRHVLPVARLHPGELVQVRSLKEIERTLDSGRTTVGLPFMTEMDEFCGKVLRVHRRVDHINDMRNKTGLRRMRNTVTLQDVRCSGKYHGQCQAECQFLWKDDWLVRLPRSLPHLITSTSRTSSPPPVRAVEQAALPADRKYFCQMTALWEASTALSPLDPRPDLRTLLSGNVGIVGFLIAVLTRLFNAVQRLRGGVGFPFMPEPAALGVVPLSNLQLKAGDTVVVRRQEEIAQTLIAGRNRGLWFDRDMVRFCGHPAVVRKRVSRVIHEGTGKMVHMTTPCVMLENVAATGEFLRLCPQHEYIFWREAWLSRTEPARAGE